MEVECEIQDIAHVLRKCNRVELRYTNRRRSLPRAASVVAVGSACHWRIRRRVDLTVHKQRKKQRSTCHQAV